jgi:hypothetical protein
MVSSFDGSSVTTSITMLSGNTGSAWGNVRNNFLSSPQGQEQGAAPGAWPSGEQQGILSNLNMLSGSPPRYEYFGGVQDYDRPSPSRQATVPMNDDAPPVMSIYDSGLATPDRGRVGFATPGSASAQRVGSYPFQQQSAAQTPSAYGNAMYAQGPRSPLASGSFGPGFASTGMSENRTTVIVFGFPISASGTVLSHFRDHGEIVYHSVDSEGNWIYIKYATRFSAQKALSKNATVLQGGMGQGGKFMVGVLEAPAEKDDEIVAALEASRPLGQSYGGTPMPGAGVWDAASTGPFANSPRPAISAGGLQAVGVRLNGGSGALGTTQRTTLPQAVMVGNTSDQPDTGSSGGILNKVGDWLLGWN